MGLKVGANNIASIYVGSVKIKKIFVGTNLVYQAGGGSKGAKPKQETDRKEEEKNT